MTIDWQMVGALATIIGVLVAIVGIIVAVIIARSQRSKAPGTRRRKSRSRLAVRFCCKVGTTVLIWCIRQISSIRQTSVAICREKKRRFQIRWTIWRKRMKVNIRHIIERDKELQKESANDAERVGVVAILLSQHLVNDGSIAPAVGVIDQTLHKEVFGMARNNHPTKFDLLCARIAEDLVTNPKARVDDNGAYVLPWNPILESFLKEAMDDPPPEEPEQGTDAE